MKTSHGRAREEREACAREEDEVQAGSRPGPTPPRSRPVPAPSGGRHASALAQVRSNRKTHWSARPDQPRPVHTATSVVSDPYSVTTGASPFDRDCPVLHPVNWTIDGPPGPRPVDRSPTGHSVCLNQIRSADVMTWREYEALRNEMRHEFRDQDEELKGTVQEVAKKLDTTNETVNAMQDQMTDIQRTIQALTLAVENLTQQQQQQPEEEDVELQDEARGVGRGVGRGNRGRGFVELGARRVPPQQDDGLGKPKFSIPKFEGGADVEEYLTWELKIEKLWLANEMFIFLNHDGILALHEIVHEVRSRHQRGVFLKLDFQKAYDRLDWSFLRQVLQRRGVDDRMIGWIMQTVMTGSTAININGEVGPYFRPACGVRQGDPLSPILFNAAVDSLAEILERARISGHITGVVGHLIPGGGVTHLQYADDTMIMFEGSDLDIQNTKFLLLCFEAMSGLKINFDKSETPLFLLRMLPRGLGYPVPSRSDPGRGPESGFVAEPPPGRCAGRIRLALMALNAIRLVLRENSL
ncbi:hypothetical protein QYE76_058591 [Lolium multiflorum]|uniref:Reverse transcriptase domain-containing protein n=1 Tax=Lolium multiflorum TaxID=4521 RepID=A0AAD8WQ19_LOLMU|nr:hypothetical protein QYE76_058591 [Lolium multiflorum]